MLNDDVAVSGIHNHGRWLDLRPEVAKLRDRFGLHVSEYNDCRDIDKKQALIAETRLLISRTARTARVVVRFYSSLEWRQWLWG